MSLLVAAMVLGGAGGGLVLCGCGRKWNELVRVCLRVVVIILMIGRLDVVVIRLGAKKGPGIQARGFRNVPGGCMFVWGTWW